MNLISQWMASIYTAAVSMGITFVLGRLLGPGKFGTYTYILTLASMFFILQDGGFKTLIFREKTMPGPALAGHNDNLFSMAFGHAAMCTAIGIIFVLVFPVPYRAGITAAFIYFFLQAIVNFISSELRAKGKFSRDAGYQVLVRTAGALGIIFVLCFFYHKPWIIFGGWAVGIGFALFLSPIPLSILLPNFCHKKQEDSPIAAIFRFRNFPYNFFTGNFSGKIFVDSGYSRIWRACLAFMAIDAATTIYYRCDILILQHFFRGSEKIGYYAAAYRFLDGIVLLAAPVGVIWFRKLRLVWKDKKLFYSEVVKISMVMVLSAGIILIAGIIYGSGIVTATFGEHYAETARILPLLLGALIFILPNTILTQAAIAQNGEGLYALVAGICALVNIGLNFILIPEFGIAGAAWATIATEALLGIGLVSELKLKKDY